MRYGLSEADDKKLEYALGASEDTRIRVTLMEAGNIQALDGDVPVAAGTDPKGLLRLVTRRNTDICCLRNVRLPSAVVWVCTRGVWL